MGLPPRRELGSGRPFGQLKPIGQQHQTGLSGAILKLFDPEPPLDYMPPPSLRKKKQAPYT
eukprot:8582701-Ditylum_brightwellii.AAC.1